MNQELQKQLAELIQKAVAAGENIADFASKQAPDLVEQLLKWKLIESGIYMAIGAAMIIGGAIAGRFLFIETRKEIHKQDEAECVFLLCGFLLGTIMGTIIFLCVWPTFVQILVAPKLYLLEYAAKLIK